MSKDPTPLHQSNEERSGFWLPLLAVLLGVVVAAGQVWFYHAIHAIGERSGVRIAAAAIAWGILCWALGRTRPWRVAVALASFAWMSVLVGLVLYYSYFGVLPTLATLVLVGQVGKIGDHILALVRFEMVAVSLLALAVCLLYVLVPREHSPKTLWHSGGIAIATALWGGVFYVQVATDLAKETHDLTVHNVVESQFYFYPTEALETYGYLAYLLYADRIQRRSVDYWRPLANPVPPHRDDPPRTSAAPNIIVIQVESLDNGLINREVNDIPVMPFLSQLAADGIYFPNIYAQHFTGGSSDAELASLTGLIPLADGPTMSFHSCAHLPSLPKLLRQKEYHAIAMHGHDGEYWNRRNAYTALGFDGFLDEDAFEGYARGYRSLDAEFLTQAAAKLVGMDQDDPRPIFAYLITQSMHSPFRIVPKQLRNPALAVEDDMETRCYQSAQYFDGALRLFFDRLEESGMRKNTIVVIYGDHCTGVVLSDDSIRQAGENVPLVIVPPQKVGQRCETFGSHLDIAPTLADLAGVPADPRWFSRSLLRWYPERLAPIVLNGKPRVITPGGAFPLSTQRDVRYRKAVEYSRSFFYQLADIERPAGLAASANWIAHALGEVDGRIYTNSESAFRSSYAKGARFFEVDLLFANDGTLFCLHPGIEKRMGLAGRPFYELTPDEIRARSIDGQTPVLEASGLIKLLAEHPDSYAILDLKVHFETGLRKLQLVCAAIDPAIMSRLIPQIYQPEELAIAQRVYPFRELIFTLYRSKIDDASVVAFALANAAVTGVTMSENRFSDAIATPLRQHGKSVFVHTVNDLQTAHSFLARGATGVYSDFLFMRSHDGVLFPDLQQSAVNAEVEGTEP